MNGIISKIARLAASKAAAFCYAVAVGVAGNLAFNFVQQHNQPVVPAAIAPETTHPMAVGPTPRRAAATASIPLDAPPALRPAPSHITAEAPPPALPDPPSVALPTSDSFRAPSLKPAALPHREEAAKAQPIPPPDTAQILSLREPDTAPAAAPARPSAAPTAVAIATPDAPATPAPLPPLGPAVDVTALPAPPAAEEMLSSPASSGPTAAIRRPAKPTTPPAGAQPLELSDLWHPGRVVRKGLHWAGGQLPDVADKSRPTFPQPAPPTPISLLPATGGPSAEKTDALVSRPKSVAPGPGSGGLY